MTDASGLMNRLRLYPLIFTLGALSLVAQVLILRQLLVVFHGSELIVALILAVWLVGVYAGARAAGRLIRSDDRAGRRLSAGVILWLSVLIGLLVLSFFIPALYGAAPGEAVSLTRIAGWTAICVFPLSVFVGGLFVLAGQTATALSDGPGAGRVGAVVFWLESAGSCLGLLLYTWLLAGRSGPMTTLGLFGGVTLAALLFFRLDAPSGRRAGAALVLIATAALWTGGAFPYIDQRLGAARFRAAHPHYRLLAMTDTPYQHLTLAERGGEKVLFGNQVFLSSWPNPYQYQVLALLYLTEAAVYDRVLLAGGGPGGFIHEFLKHDVKQLTYVALDSEETGLIRAHLPTDSAADLQDPRLTVVHGDVRRFLDATDERFDLVVINAPDPDAARINRLYTIEFFRAAANRLSPRGVLITSVSGAENYWGRTLISFGRSLYQTLEEVFPEVVVSAGDTHHFFAGRRPGLVTDDPDRLGRRYRERGFSSEYMTPRSFYRFFPPSAMDYLEAKLKAPEEVRLNTDDRPVSYYLRLMWWEQMTGDPASRAVIQALFRVGDWGPWALAVFAIGWIWLFVRARPGPTAVWTMFLTGGAAMSLQLTLIFLYQNKYGILYQQIGLISAVFMAGLAVGGRLVARRSSSDTPFRWAPISETLLIAAALLTWAAVVYDWSWLILPLVGLTGLGGGLGFASLFALYLQDPADPSARSALAGLEAADHGGAAAGALIAGLSLAPVIGLGPTAALLAGMKLVGLAAVGRTVFKLVRPAG